MTLTEDQIAHCKVIIAGMVKYQESYEELTDHILTAMEAMPQTDKPYYEVLEQVICNDFGGKENIAALEKEREKIVLKRLRKQQWTYTLQHFKIPLIGFTILLTAVTYFALGSIIKPKPFFVILTLITLCPILIMLFNDIRRLTTKPRIKKSVKDGIFYTNAYLSMSLLNMVNFAPQVFAGRDNYLVLLHASTAILTVIIVFFTVYTLSFIKLYQEEHKMQLV